MELRQLRSFLILAEELHQGRAAARLGIEQPSLSRQMRDFEDELGVQLFHRTTRATWLSEAGEALLENARRIIADEQMTRETLIARHTTQKRLRIGFSEGFVGAQVGNLLRHLESPPLDVRTILIERNLPELMTMLVTGSIDAIFAPEQAGTADTVSIKGWTEPLAALVPAGVTMRAPLSLTRLPLPMFMPDSSALPGFTRQIDELLGPHVRRPASRFAHVATLYALVGTGHGMGLLPHTRTMGRAGVRPENEPIAVASA
ncbi:LysR family transcriptional regulator [soil metagenome]